MRLKLWLSLIAFVCFICIINAIPSFIALDSSTLKTVNIFFRHGARTPIAQLPRGAKFEKFVWAGEEGELTSVGKQQMFRVGEILRDLYQNFINDVYKPNDIYATSTHAERTFMSAACLLAGMYPPKGHQRWSEDIPWSPVPIWADEVKVDQSKVINAKNVCPRFETEQALSVQKAVNDNRFNFQDVFLTVTQFGGKLVNNIFDMFEVWDNLECLEHNNLPVPSWTNTVYPIRMAQVAAKVLRALIVGSKKMIRLTAGNFMKQLHEQFDLAKTKKDHRKIVLHGGHDFSMTAVLASLGIFEKLVNPSDTIVLELHETPIGFVVQFLYIDNGGTRVTTQSIPKCGNPCLLKTFLELTKDVVINDWDQECKR